MGEAKRRALSEQAAAAGTVKLTDEERMRQLGSDPFNIAFEYLFQAAQAGVKATGLAGHGLHGLVIGGGRVASDTLMPIPDHRKKSVPRLLASMLDQFPLVGHMFDAFYRPSDGHGQPLPNAERKDAVMISLHTPDVQMAAICLVDVHARTVEKGELIVCSSRGTMGRPMPEPGPKH